MSGATIIDVTFVDADTGSPFLQLKLPLRQLSMTTMTLGKDDWLVVGATPAGEEEIVRAGKVRLVLRKVQYVDPATILFSLPTVADVIPELTAEGDLAQAFRLSEDDWLQLELVPSEAIEQAQGDLEAIRAILANERKGAGFQRLHVRQGLPAPFGARELRVTTLRGLFGGERPVAYRGGSGVLEGCFAFTLPSGAVLYGQAQAGRVIALGLSAPDPDALARLDGLTLIDWCAAEAKRA